MDVHHFRQNSMRFNSQQLSLWSVPNKNKQKEKEKEKVEGPIMRLFTIVMMSVTI